MIQSEIDTIKSLTNNIIGEATAIKFTEGQSLEDIKSEYGLSIHDIMDVYSTSDRIVTGFRNTFYRATTEAFTTTAETAWTDGGASLPMTDELSSWIDGQINNEMAFIDDLFAQLRELRKAGIEEDINIFIEARTEGYVGALQGVYNYAKLAAAPDRDGQWAEGDTIEKCETCLGLDGQIHPLRWYKDNNYIPQQRGSETLDCGGWRCLCTIRDPKTGEQLIP